MLLNSLRDLTRHTSGLDIDMIKIIGDNGSVEFEGINDDKTVVLKGNFVKNVPELEGTFGLSQLDYLTKCVNEYKQKDDSIEVVRVEKTFSVATTDNNGTSLRDDSGEVIYEKITEDIIERLVFSRKSPKMVNPYRVLDRRMITEQPSFKGAEWDVVITPTSQAINSLAVQAGMGVEEYFGVKTEDKILYLTFGDTSSQAIVEFAHDVDGEITRSWIWGVGPVLNILKMSDNADCTMSFLDKGALQITLETGLAKYNYIMPAKAR